ncbi:peptidase family M1 [Cooperia oncophora]
MAGEVLSSSLAKEVLIFSYRSLPTEHKYVNRVISYCAAGIRSEQQIEQLRNLQKTGRHARDYGAFDQAIEQAEHKVAWIKKHFRKLSDFFKRADKGHHDDDDKSPSAEELRLPKSIRPLSYDLTIKTYLPNYVQFPPEKNLTFDGQVKISLMVLEPTKSIVLNANNITVIPEECELFLGSQKIVIENVTYHRRLQKVEFLIKERLEKNQNVLLNVVYTGVISKILGGLYQATYTHRMGAPSKISSILNEELLIAATSQMEPTDARRMVPCLDEPSFKANWTVTVIHPKGTRAASNGSNGIEIGEGEISGDWVTSKFETTPPMSSYLLAVIVSEFGFIQGFRREIGVLRSDMVHVRGEDMTHLRSGLLESVKLGISYEKLSLISNFLLNKSKVRAPLVRREVHVMQN